MFGCHCICGLHRAFVTVVCTGEPIDVVRLASRHEGRITIPMCRPCAAWWRGTGPYARKEVT